MSVFEPSLDDLRLAVDAELDRFLSAVRADVDKSDDLVDEITSLLRAGGKRIRPAFCYWGFRAAGRDGCGEIVRVAASLELLHTFALVHDDIMDASEERRGLPTVHTRRGVGSALLVGDLALVLADDLFMTSGFDPDALHHAFSTYSRMRKQVIVGQNAEFDLLSRPEVDVDEARLIARMKSGRYSIREPLVIGACLGAGPEGLVHGLSEFGESLGEAFQIRDDLLGTFGTRAEVGKPVDSDMREGKRNVLYALTIRLLDGAERDFFVNRWGSGEDLSNEDAARVRALIESCGALTATEALLEDLRAAARAALDGLDLGADSRVALEDLVELVTRRRL